MTTKFATFVRSASLAIAISASLITAASATGAQIATAEQRRACTPDAFRLCSSQIPNIPAITACMHKNFDNLSPACKAVFPR
jgi:hypothetical protein